MLCRVRWLMEAFGRLVRKQKRVKDLAWQAGPRGEIRLEVALTKRGLQHRLQQCIQHARQHKIVYHRHMVSTMPLSWHDSGHSHSKDQLR